MPTSTEAPPRPATLTHLRAAASTARAAVEQRDRHVVDAVREGHPVAAVARAADIDRATVQRILNRSA